MLTIYAPLHNPKSKAFEVFKGIEKSWPEKILIKDNSKESEPEPNSMFWGFVSNNLEMIQKLESRKHNYWFTDTPYFGRFDNKNLLKTIIIGEFVKIKSMLSLFQIVNQIDLTNLKLISKHLI